MLKEFKQFILRGNVIDLAVGVIMGAAFGSVVNTIVSGILTPLIAAIFHLPALDAFTFTVRGSTIYIGSLIDALIYFVLVAAAVFFFIVKPINVLVSRSRREPPADPTTKKCGECLSEIPLAARRCAHCAQPVA